jgi:hypothetical protein
MGRHRPCPTPEEALPPLNFVRSQKYSGAVGFWCLVFVRERARRMHLNEPTTECLDAEGARALDKSPRVNRFGQAKEGGLYAGCTQSERDEA